MAASDSPCRNESALHRYRHRALSVRAARSHRRRLVPEGLASVGFLKDVQVATVCHRTKRTKGCLSRQTGLAMAFKLMIAAQGKWRKLNGRNRLPEIIEGVEFRDGLRQLQTAA